MGIEQGHLESEMNRGFLQVLVLITLEKRMYGYQMMKYLESHNYRLEENTLYPLLRRLEKYGLVASEWSVESDRPRKFYQITAQGRTIRTGILTIWQEQKRIIKTLLEEQKNG